MLVRRIALQNIRSYNDGAETAVDVPEGIVLFEGDVGSGKSTLLYAIEFALFGFSDLKGSHLLSEGRQEGRVGLTFSADGKEYEVRRTIRRRGDDVVQGECYITVNGTKTRLSPSDLKERVVSILKFKEPTHPKAESLVYRYAVFTPQEQMKAILLQNSEDRLQVIRHVLGAQSYEVAASNSEVVARKLKEMSYGRQKAAEDLDDKKAQMAAKSDALAELDSKMPSLERQESRLRAEVEGLEAESRALQDRKEIAKAAEANVPVLRKSIKSLESQTADAQRRADELARRLDDELVPSVDAFRKRRAPEKGSRETALELAAERVRLGTLKGKMDELAEELEGVRRLKPGGTCPTCGQEIPQGFARSGHMETEYRTIEAQVAPAELHIASLSAAEEVARDYEQDARECAANVGEIDRLRLEEAGIRATLENLETELGSRKAELVEAEAEAKEMSEVIAVIDDLDSRLAAAKAERDTASKLLVQAQTERRKVAEERDELSKEVERKTKLVLEARRFSSYQAWLSEFFSPTVEEIEKRTLAYANARFSQHFQRFFASLVDDPEMTVRVKEDFSPVFERQGFEQDFEALSGGERTSMSLAYRFALNSVVREDISSQTELVILDEPTEGFSKEQVYKMRGLLEELDSRQVILVSHERELESMADQVFKVEKASGTSRVTRA